MATGTVTSKATPTKKPRKNTTTKPRKQAAAPVVAPASTDAPLIAETDHERELIQMTREHKAKWADIRAKQIEDIGKRIDDLAARQSSEDNTAVTKLLDRFLGNSSYAPPEIDENYEAPEYFKLQIVLPLALSLVKNVIKAEDLYSDTYNLTNMMDWMMDAIPEMFDLMDEAALIEYLNQKRPLESDSHWAIVGKDGLPVRL